MTNCPVCNAQVTEKAKFCSECGSQLTEAASERAWIIAMQERIKSARHNDALYNVVAIVGILLAIAIPFIMRFVLRFTMDTTSWSLTGVAVILIIGSVIGIMFDNHKVRQLIEQLEAGPQEEEEAEEGEEEPEEEKKEE
jgi:predicted tellurium resistance membrane protein TerC